MSFDLFENSDRYEDCLLDNFRQLAGMGLLREVSLDFPLSFEEPINPSLPEMLSLFQIQQNSQTAGNSEQSLPQKIAKNSEKNIDNVYEKNICAYISKIVYQNFVECKYKKKVMKICRQLNIDYQSVMSYYRSLVIKGFGITLLMRLITPEDQEQILIKKVFSTFLNWFLREKYVLYMLQYGKMQEKEKYIEFKNKYLLYIVEVEDKFTCNF